MVGAEPEPSYYHKSSSGSILDRHRYRQLNDSLVDSLLARCHLLTDFASLIIRSSVRNCMGSAFRKILLIARHI